VADKWIWLDYFCCSRLVKNIYRWLWWLNKHILVSSTYGAKWRVISGPSWPEAELSQSDLTTTQCCTCIDQIWAWYYCSLLSYSIFYCNNVMLTYSQTDTSTHWQTDEEWVMTQSVWCPIGWPVTESVSYICCPVHWCRKSILRRKEGMHWICPS